MLAGLNRKRKNAVDHEAIAQVTSGLDGTGKRPRGRPSKGGEAMRAKRYYAKKHLLILQKRKLRRYIVKVKKLVSEDHFQVAVLKEKFDKYVNEYKVRDNREAKTNDIIRAVDLAREDSYLGYLNDIARAYIAELDVTSTNEEIEKLMASLASQNSGRLFQLSTYWSAYLLLKHAEDELAIKGTLNETERLEKIQEICLTDYEITYSHLTGEELPESLTSQFQENSVVKRSTKKKSAPQGPEAMDVNQVEIKGETIVEDEDEYVYASAEEHVAEKENRTEQEEEDESEVEEPLRSPEEEEEPPQEEQPEKEEKAVDEPQRKKLT